MKTMGLETTDNAVTPVSGTLPLDSLEIKNFRAFRHLTIEKLGRVNLITGKNNVGKTSLLEAVWVYAKHARPGILRSLLERREEIGEPLRFAGTSHYSNQATDDSLGWLPYIGTLFYNREDLFENGEPFLIGPINQPETQLEININFYQVDEQGNLPLKSDKSLDLTLFSEKVSLRSRLKAKPFIRIKAAWLPDSVLPLEEFFGFNTAIYWTNAHYILTEFVSTDDSREDDRRWEAIKLNGFRNTVLEALHLLDDQITDLDFFSRGKDRSERSPMVKIQGEQGFIPLKRRGEGMTRLLQFALAAPLATNGILLLDEVENGLHYSIQPKVWRFIFQLARQFNVQVFATTHSWDCIEAFYQAATEDEDPTSGVLVRLQRDGDDVTSTVFDEHGLEVITRRGIEVR